MVKTIAEENDFFYSNYCVSFHRYTGNFPRILCRFQEKLQKLSLKLNTIQKVVIVAVELALLIGRPRLI